MDFDSDQESITPTQRQYVKIDTTGALWLPTGNNAQRPSSPSTGLFRYNTDTPGLEYWNGSAWTAAGAGGGGAATPESLFAVDYYIPQMTAQFVLNEATMELNMSHPLFTDAQFSPAVGQRVYIEPYTDKSKEGIYVTGSIGTLSAVPLTRHADWPATRQLTPGTTIRSLMMPKPIKSSSTEGFFSGIIDAANINPSLDSINYSSSPLIYHDSWMYFAGLDTSAVMPGGLSLNTPYYIVDNGDNTFSFSTVLGGSLINITSAGTNGLSGHICGVYILAGPFAMAGSITLEPHGDTIGLSPYRTWTWGEQTSSYATVKRGNYWRAVPFDYRDVAVGYNAAAFAEYTVAVGDSAKAISYGSTAVGYQATALGTSSTVLGSYAAAYAADSIAIGGSSIGYLAADGGIAIGSNAVVGSSGGVTLGKNASVTAVPFVDGGVALGVFSESVSGGVAIGQSAALNPSEYSYGSSYQLFDSTQFSQQKLYVLSNFFNASAGGQFPLIASLNDELKSNLRFHGSLVFKGTINIKATTNFANDPEDSYHAAIEIYGYAVANESALSVFGVSHDFAWREILSSADKPGIAKPVVETREVSSTAFLDFYLNFPTGTTIENVTVTATITATQASNNGISRNTDFPLDLSPPEGACFAVASANLAGGDWVNLYVDAGVTKIRKASAASGYPIDGFVLTRWLTSERAIVWLVGINNQVSGMTTGSPVYLSTTAGTVTHTAPSAGNLVQRCGIALSATKVLFKTEYTIQT